MQSKPMKETDPRDVFAIESLLAAHAEKAPPPAHDPAAAAPAPPAHVVPPIARVEPPPVEPAFRAADARDIPVENARSSEIKVDVLKPPGAQPVSKGMKRVVMAVLALLGATAAAGWHQYGDQAKAMASEWAPPIMLAALPSATRSATEEQPSAPVAAATATDQIAAQQPAAPTAADQPAPATVAAAAPAADSDQLQSMARDLAAMGQQVDELKATIAQLKAGQAQMARELAKASEGKAAETRPAEQPLRPKVSALTAPTAQRPAPPPVRKPKPVASTYAPAYAT
ncbi:MAG: hypothetical protein ABUL53_02985, partial [Bradyrhizobium guangdongense]